MLHLTVAGIMTRKNEACKHPVQTRVGFFPSSIFDLRLAEYLNVEPELENGLSYQNYLIKSYKIYVPVGRWRKWDCTCYQKHILQGSILRVSSLVAELLLRTQSSGWLAPLVYLGLSPWPHFPAPSKLFPRTHLVLGVHGCSGQSCKRH